MDEHYRRCKTKNKNGAKLERVWLLFLDRCKKERNKIDLFHVLGLLKQTTMSEESKRKGSPSFAAKWKAFRATFMRAKKGISPNIGDEKETVFAVLLSDTHVENPIVLIPTMQSPKCASGFNTKTNFIHGNQSPASVVSFPERNTSSRSHTSTFAEILPPPPPRWGVERIVSECASSTTEAVHVERDNTSNKSIDCDRSIDKISIRTTPAYDERSVSKESTDISVDQPIEGLYRKATSRLSFESDSVSHNSLGELSDDQSSVISVPDVEILRRVFCTGAGTDRLEQIIFDNYSFMIGDEKTRNGECHVLDPLGVLCSNAGTGCLAENVGEDFFQQIENKTRKIEKQLGCLEFGQKEDMFSTVIKKSPSLETLPTISSAGNYYSRNVEHVGFEAELLI